MNEILFYFYFFFKPTNYILCITHFYNSLCSVEASLSPHGSADPIISGLVSCISLHMYGSQRLSPSVLFFVGFLIPFHKVVRLFTSVRQETGFFTVRTMPTVWHIGVIYAKTLIAEEFLSSQRNFLRLLLDLTSGPLHTYQVSEIRHLL